MHSRKSLLFNNTDIWIKKNGYPDFDVTMGSFDGEKLCELAGLYILHILGEKYGKHRIGLYLDNGLACFGYTSGPQADRKRKYFIKIFKEDFDLSITCETKLKAVNFLDVTLNLTTGKYQPCNKPDNNPLYINILSNHPPNIIKIFLAIYLKELTIYQQVKHHLITLRIYITMHWPKVDLNIRYIHSSKYHQK